MESARAQQGGDNDQNNDSCSGKSRVKQLLSWLTSSRGFDSTEFPPLIDEDLITYDWARIIERGLVRLGMAEDSVAVEMRITGYLPKGLPCYSGFIKIVRWMPEVTPILLLNLPLIDERIRKDIQALDQHKQAHFAGLWIHASAHMRDAPPAFMRPHYSPASVL